MKTRLVLTVTLILLGQPHTGCAGEGPEDPAAAETVTMETIVAGNTAFAFDLYARLKDAEGNLFFSPYSVAAAMAMTYAGARDRTAAEMAQTLHFAPDAAAFHRAVFHQQYGGLIEQLNRQGQQGDYSLSVANALWLQKDFAFLPVFTDLIGDHYDAALETVDFVNAAEPARQTINQWVEDQTNEKIRNLIPPGVLNAMTRLVLTNAIYFKGDWAEQFDKEQTHEERFYLETPPPVMGRTMSNRETVQVPMMRQKGEYQYTEQYYDEQSVKRSQVQILELPYKGDELSMVILLPDSRAIWRLEGFLTAENLKKWTGHLRPRDVEVYLPKFKMTSQFSLSATLAAMGMPSAFGSGADFSGMTGAKDLFISDVIHKAFVEVNEEGTEAAAATGVIMALKSVPTPPPVFRADRPFVFVIRDNRTGSLLFIGRVTDPTATEASKGENQKAKTVDVPFDK